MEDEVEISLEDLGKTYQQILANHSNANPDATETQMVALTEPSWTEEDQADATESVPTTPEGILEAVLFVGHPSNQGVSADNLASIMRGIKVDEIHEVVQRLNQRYCRNRQSLRVIECEGGYRMGLAAELNEIKSVFAGKVQPVKLNQHAIDCLAVVAYSPGISPAELDKQLGRNADAVVRMLIRRNLIEVQIEGTGKNAHRQLFTTDRFLNLVGLESIEDLPVI